MKKLLSITSLCLALLMISFSTVFAVDNSTPSNSDKSQNANQTMNNTMVVVNTEPTKVDTPKELQELYPNTNFTVTKLGEVGEYSLYYNVTHYYQFLDYNVTIGEYIFNCFAQQKPYDLGLYVVGNSKAYTLADAYKELKIDIDTVYSLITSKYINYNFTVGKSIPDVTTQPSENHNVYYYLKGATSSNNETTVGNHYNTVIKPNSPYEIDYVVVTVNNKEREVTKNSDGSYTIDLDNVDGDINIFASATREKVTQFSTARVGWYVNYNLSNVESSNTTDDVWLNYKTTLTPKEGYAITYVSATVNGKDVGKITKNNGIYTIDIEKVTGNLTITAEAKNVVTDTPKEIQKLSPKTNFTVANLGKVGNYNLYYNVTQYYQFFENIIKIGNYEFDCFAQQSPYGLGLYVVGNGKAYTLKDAYDKLNINMDAVYSLINKTNLHYNFTVVKIAQEKLSATNVSLKSGATKTIKVLNGKVKSYKVTNNKVAKVNSKGVVTALNKGKTTVIVTLKDGNKLNCKVNVTTAPKLSKSTVNLKVGQSAKIKIYGKAKGIEFGISGRNKNVEVWLYKMKDATEFRVEGLKKGKATLKVKVNNVKTLTLKVNVK
ncbi:MAG: Ig-like domain-containing protein [Ruminococcus sp.]|nr:Ig-like domain-containing protein [Ruminococcus sp.]MCI6504899.1 Ig-like domain-containing protein [Ruminococcus sp.]